MILAVAHSRAMKPMSRRTRGVTSDVRFGEQTYVVSDEPPGVDPGGSHWWLLFDDAWFRVVPRLSARLPVRAVRAWLHNNVVYPEADPTNGERGPAWTTSEAEPLVFVDRGAPCRIWADSELRASPDSPDETTHWIVEYADGSRSAARLNCDDTVAEVLRAVRGLGRRDNNPRV
jgi:hypothetical protein